MFAYNPNKYKEPPEWLLSQVQPTNATFTEKEEEMWRGKDHHHGQRTGIRRAWNYFQEAGHHRVFRRPLLLLAERTYWKHKHAVSKICPLRQPFLPALWRRTTPNPIQTQPQTQRKNRFQIAVPRILFTFAWVVAFWSGIYHFTFFLSDFQIRRNFVSLLLGNVGFFHFSTQR